MTGSPVGSRTVSVRADTRDLQLAIAAIPRSVYFWMRAYMFQLARVHRSTWLAHKGTRFGRISKSGRGILVPKVNEGQVPPRDNEVSYQVGPREERMPDVASAKAGIGALRADMFTGNKILQVHEEGIDIRSSGWMAVPNKTRPGNIHRWRERNPGAVLITLPSKRGNDKRLVYEVRRVRMRGRVRADFIGPAPTREKLRLRFVLTKFVEMDPTLHFYDSWDLMQSEQDTLWPKFADRILQDLLRGVAS